MLLVNVVSILQQQIQVPYKSIQANPDQFYISLIFNFKFYCFKISLFYNIVGIVKYYVCVSVQSSHVNIVG